MPPPAKTHHLPAPAGAAAVVVHEHPRHATHPERPAVVVDIAPGRSVIPLPAKEAASVAVFDLIAVGDFLRPVARVHARRLRLTEDVTERLGLGIDYKTLKRLIVAGFVDGEKVSPRVITFSLPSYYAHVDACRRDPEFWNRRENLLRYNDARLEVR